MCGAFSEQRTCFSLLQWLRSSACPRLTLRCRDPSSPNKLPAPSTSCLCCCASDSAAATCPSSKRCARVLWWIVPHAQKYTQTAGHTCSLGASSLLLLLQTLDSSELNGDGIVLSLEEQLSALSLTSSPPQSGPDCKDVVALYGTRFPSQLFEETSESTKVGNHSHHLDIFPTSRPLSYYSSLVQISAMVSELKMIREKNSDQKR